MKRPSCFVLPVAWPIGAATFAVGRRCSLATIKPTTMIDLYATPGLQDVAREVESTLEAIMAEAAGS